MELKLIERRPNLKSEEGYPMQKQEDKQVAIDKENIDYMHPHGKPTAQESKKTEEELVQEQKSVQKAIDEADGHHMCSDACQRHHRV